MRTIDMLKRMTLGMGVALLSAQAIAAPTGFYISFGAGQAEQDIDRNSSAGFLNLTTPTPPGAPVSDPIGTALQTTFAVDGKSFGWNASLGYRLNDYFAAEIAYMDFGRAEIKEDLVPIPLAQLPTTPVNLFRDAPLPPGSFTPIDINDPSLSLSIPARFRSDITGPALSVLGSLPIATRFSAYLRAGVIFVQQDVAPRGRTSGRGVSFRDEVLLGGIGGTYDLSPRFTLRAEYQRSDDIDSNDIPTSTRLEQFQLSVLYQLQ